MPATTTTLTRPELLTAEDMDVFGPCDPWPPTDVDELEALNEWVDQMEREHAERYGHDYERMADDFQGEG